MKLSNVFSRQSSHNTEDGNNTQVKGLDISIHELEVYVTGHKLEKFHIIKQNDAELWMLIKHKPEGWPDIFDQCLEPICGYFTLRYELSVVDKISIKRLQLYGHFQSLRSDALNKLHFSHLGSTKTILRARTFSLLARIESRYQETNC